MNIIERQTNLSKSLYEINTTTIKELASAQLENVNKYFETNREFASRIPEITNITDFLGLQREYNETLWNSARGAVESQVEIVREAAVGTRDAVKVAFSAEESAEAETAKPVVEAKSKPKSKKAAA